MEIVEERIISLVWSVDSFQFSLYLIELHFYWFLNSENPLETNTPYMEIKFELQLFQCPMEGFCFLLQWFLPRGNPSGQILL